MRPWTLSVLSGAAGFLLGWLTRPFIEARGAALTIGEVWHHALASEDEILHAAAHQTAAHIGMFGAACALLGYVAARLTRY